MGNSCPEAAGTSGGVSASTASSPAPAPAGVVGSSSPDGAPGFSKGAIIEINERVLEPEQFVTRVAQMDETGINLLARRGSLQVGDLHHTFTETAEGTLYQSRLVVGSTVPVLGKILTRVVKKRIFTPEMGQAWFKHNIEEVGNFEFFLPGLYAEQQEAA